MSMLNKITSAKVHSLFEMVLESEETKVRVFLTLVDKGTTLLLAVEHHRWSGGTFARFDMTEPITLEILISQLRLGSMGFGARAVARLLLASLGDMGVEVGGAPARSTHRAARGALREAVDILKELPGDDEELELQCPLCGHTCRVFHMEWGALECMGCKQAVEQDSWVRILEVN